MTHTRGENLNVDEIETLRKVHKFKTRREAAEALFITREGLKYRLAVIERKAGVSGVPQLCVWAERHGLLDKPDEADE